MHQPYYTCLYLPWLLSCILQNMSYIVKPWRLKVFSVLLSLRILIFPSQTLGVMVYHWLVVRSAYMDIRETPVLPVYVDDNVDDDTKIEKAGGKYIRL